MLVRPQVSTLCIVLHILYQVLQVLYQQVKENTVGVTEIDFCVTHTHQSLHSNWQLELVSETIKQGD